MITCSQCAAQLAPGTNFCHECGTPIPVLEPRFAATEQRYAQLKQGVTVDNKPGANSAVGTDFVAKAKADGYTLLVSSSGGLTVNPVLMKNLPYDPLKDFEPIALLGSFPLIVTVPATLPVKSLAELIRYGKTAKDGTLNHGVASSSFQLAAETLSTAAGVRFTVAVRAL